MKVMLRLLFSSTILFYFQMLNAQNLVPNPSFEEYNTAPSKLGDFSGLTHWTTPSKADQPDFFHALGSGACKLPSSAKGEVKPRNNGKGVVGLIPYKKSEKNYREYITVRLKSPLEVGERYIVSMHITNGISNQYGKYGVNGLGVCFTERPLTQQGTQPINAKPQYVMGKVVYRNYWKQISFEFSPKKPFDYLTIGNFWYDGNIVTEVEEDATGLPLCYYFIDEVEVVKKKKKPQDRKTVYPSLTKKDDATSIVKAEDNKVLSTGGVINLNLFYETNGYTMQQITQPSVAEITSRLDNIVQFLRTNPNLRIEVGGHTNGRCDDDFCKKLSTQRAKAIADYLISKQVRKSQIKYKGYGKEKPIASDNTKAGRMKNQRVEIKVLR